jgi:hypothetical protein
MLAFDSIGKVLKSHNPKFGDEHWYCVEDNEAQFIVLDWYNMKRIPKVGPHTLFKIQESIEAIFGVTVVWRMFESDSRFKNRD